VKNTFKIDVLKVFDRDFQHWDAQAINKIYEEAKKESWLTQARKGSKWPT
jgi:hypothetical protein